MKAVARTHHTRRSPQNKVNMPDSCFVVLEKSDKSVRVRYRGRIHVIPLSVFETSDAAGDITNYLDELLAEHEDDDHREEQTQRIRLS